ncbi:MAG TPA: sigma-70 family RNA polymerase sigma factor [Thermoanaerobaculia bacterium]|nr:sigma-70 family RNA polymerase sigma factor [Thermoanaerobaculia bacterium]
MAIPASAQQASADPFGDSALIARARSGDVEAREHLARRYRDPAYLLALQLLGDPEEARDLTQECLMRFFVTLERFDAERPVLPWLRRIVRNGAVDLIRRRRVRRADSLDSSGPEGEAIEVHDARADTQAGSLDRERQRLVWGCVQQLRAAHREIVVLRDYQDLSYEQIAAVLDVPVGTVMSRLHRARQALRARVVEQVPELVAAARPSGGDRR